MPPIHVCVHSLRDNGCSPGDIEIASVKVTYLSVHESRRERRVGGSPVGRVKHKSISLHSTASGEKATTGPNVSKVHGRWTFGTFVSTFLFALRNIYARQLALCVSPAKRRKRISFDIYYSSFAVSKV